MGSLPLEVNWDLTIATYDVDKERRLKLSSQMKLQQEIGEMHLQQCGLPYGVLFDKGMVWVLTRSRAVIYRQPTLESHVYITTWEKGSRGAQFFRCYRFTDESGEVLIDACSGFALVDSHTHAPMRPKAFHDICDVENNAKETTCPRPEKLRLPDVMKPVGVRTVRYSDIDYNGHLNNTVYADLLCDFVPGGMHGRTLREFGLQYCSEAVEGDDITISAGEVDGTIYISGDHGRGRCFDGFLRFAE